MKKQFHVVTAFPEMFAGVFGESILKRAQEKGVAVIAVHDLRDFTFDKHKTVDDYPFGGGSGMILKPEPIFLCVEDILEKNELRNPRIILTTPAGRKFDQHYANEMAADERDVVIICGHYKGVDERVREHLATEEISIGDYVLTGGEIPAMVIVDAVVRLLPGVIGDFDSAAGDSFQSGLLDHPHYTRPRDFRGMKVPEVLLSGDHARIEQWRKEMALKFTRARRQDLLQEKNEDEKK